MKLTALIEREGNGYVSLCPELDIASQGDTVEASRDNLREAIELFFRVRVARGSQAAPAWGIFYNPVGGKHWLDCASSQEGRLCDLERSRL